MNGLAYMKMLKDLKDKYEVHSIDLPGMGLSSRDMPSEEISSNQLAIDYFVNAIESYRKVSGLDRFTLVGHSFGGFMGANYAMKHPEYLNNLVLLSPLGVTYKSKEEILK